MAAITVALQTRFQVIKDLSISLLSDLLNCLAICTRGDGDQTPEPFFPLLSDKISNP
ncbi:hypothetical protein Scep_023757 [Stephania cephalantha]|uniref:Uncharacterized protein n=1 Tax=Stephania cephalantha TaxID=152367 RepID=A0AAP0EY70_9MAGN